MKSKSHISYLTTYLFLFIIFFFFTANIIAKDKSFSEQENRYLQTAPKLSFKKLVNGDFTSEYEKYLSDQFVFRNNWIALKARSELALGKMQNNDVFLHNKLLLSPILNYKEDIFSSNVESVKKIAQVNQDKVFFALIPNKEAIYTEYLPKNLDPVDTYALIESAYLNSGANCIRIKEALIGKKTEYIYYNTDHHWTSLGAYYGYGAVAEVLGFDKKDIKEYDRKVVSDSFSGTNVSASGFYWFMPDSMEIFVPENDDILILNYSTGKAEKIGLYAPEFLEKKDKYKFYFGGNTPLIEIENKKAPQKSIIIIRDSFCDSLLPFLKDEYSNISVIDLRYYNESLNDYIKEHKFDQILIIYGIRTFAEDNNLYKLNQ